MYPKLTEYTATKASTLREFIAGLGGDLLYTYDKRLIGVIVNDEPKWPSARIKPGDKVTVFPIMTGG